MTTGALGTTAPVVSVTVPVMVPLPVDWALDGMAAHSSSAAADARAKSRFKDTVKLMGFELLVLYGIFPNMLYG
jgi:hypothetical protein